MNEKNLLTFLGLIRRAGRLETGMDRALEAISADKARLICISSDISANSRKKITSAAQTFGIGVAALPCTTEEFGTAVGVGGTAIAAVCDRGFAKALLEKINTPEPG